MEYFERLTSERKSFLERLNTLVYNEFDRQKREDNIGKDREEILENNIKTISINAGWGEGKSFFSKALTEKLEGNGIEVLSFNAWKSDYYNDALKSFLGEMMEQLMIKGHPTDEIEKKMLTILKNSSKILGKIAIKKVGITDDDLKNVQEVFSGVSDSFFKDYRDYKEAINGFKESLETLTKTNNKVVIIDELDRCKPTFAIELLEAIKHIFDIEGLIVVFLINKEQLDGSVKSMYGEVNRGEGYFKKFFDLTFNLPKLNIEEYNEKELNFVIDNISDKESPDYDDVNLVSNYIFSNLLKNINEDSLTAREINLMHKKYYQLLLMLSKNEKRNIAFNVLLATYFIYREMKRYEGEKFESWFIKNFKFKQSFNLPFRMYYKIEKEAHFLNYLEVVRQFIINKNRKEYKIKSLGCKMDKRTFGNCLECEEFCNIPAKQEILDKGNLHRGFWQKELFDKSVENYLIVPVPQQYRSKKNNVSFNSLIKSLDEIYNFTISF